MLIIFFAVCFWWCGVVECDVHMVERETGGEDMRSYLLAQVKEPFARNASLPPYLFC